MTVLGIDPGAHGGFCVLTPALSIVKLAIMPTVANEIDIFHAHELIKSFKNIMDMAYLEKSQPFPGMSARAQFMVGKAFAIIETLLVVNSIPYVLVPPITWTKQMHKGVSPKLKAKEKSLIIAKRMFPGIAEICTTPRGRLQDGLIDAALIAAYGVAIHKKEI